MSTLGYGFMFSTMSSIEGFKILQHCGVVFGDAVFTPNFTAMTSTRDRSMAHAMLFSSAKMDGTEELINTARDHAYSSMREKAKKLGANAVIDVRSDNSFGHDVIHISLYGTAVRVVSLKEYDAKLAAEQESLRQKEEEQKKIEANAQRRIQEMKDRHSTGDFSREEKFLAELKASDSVMAIWDLWCSSGLDQVYVSITNAIKAERNSERMYGRIASEVNKVKNMIREAILAE